MHIENLAQNDGKVQSVLEGRLVDQAALSGILNKLYELHLPVMSVDCFGVPDTGLPRVSRTLLAYSTSIGGSA